MNILGMTAPSSDPAQKMWNALAFAAFEQCEPLATWQSDEGQLIEQGAIHRFDHQRMPDYTG